MSKKSHAPPPKRHRFRVGQSVVPTGNAYPGANPMVVHVVTAVHRDGSVDVVATDGPPIERVPAHELWDA